MSTNRGIFESFPNQPSARPDSPFAMVPDETPPAAAATSPFMAVARQESPFTVAEDSAESRPVESGKPAKLPERRKSESPFQIAEPSEGFGFEAPAKPYTAAPFETQPAASPAISSPFSTPAQPATPTSPFSSESARGASPSTQAALAAFGNWQEPATAPPSQAASVPQAFSQPTPSVFANSPAASPPAQVPAAFAQESQSAPDPADDSFSIRQIELRAIFGVDREMNVDEILQRTRALPGIRNIARVSSQNMASVEALKQLLPNLGFGSGPLKLYSGSVPLEFIREGSVMLAVQAEGGFAPGIRETLILVARELGRLS
jgi:hypothetical protein